MGKMKELYTTLQESQVDPRALDFDQAVRIVDWLNKSLYAEPPDEDVEA